MSNIAEHLELYDLAYDRFKKLTEGRKIDAGNIIVFVTLAMEIANQFTEFQGFEKKELVLELMDRLVDEMPMDEEDRQIIQTHFKVTLERTIDILISAAGGRLELGDEVSQPVGCFPCFGVRSKKKKRKNKKKNRKVLRRQALRTTTVQELVDIIYDQVKKSVSNKKLRPANVIILVTITMQVVEQYPHLQGYEKKEIALNVIERILLEIPMNEEDRVLVQLLFRTTISRTIDYIIFAANGALDMTAIASCCPCFQPHPNNEPHHDEHPDEEEPHHDESPHDGQDEMHIVEEEEGQTGNVVAN